MNKFLVALLLGFTSLTTLTGCTNHFGNDLNEATLQENSRINSTYILSKSTFIGETTSTTPLTATLSITTVVGSPESKEDIFGVNNVCDLSVIRQDNSGKNLPIIGLPHLGEKVTAYGYNFYTGSTQKSVGKNLGYAYLHENKKDQHKCKVMISDVGSDDGFKGGPVYDEKGYLIGVALRGVKLYYEKNTGSVPSEYDENGRLIKNQSVSKSDNVKRVNYTVYIPIIEIYDWLNNRVDLMHSEMKTTNELKSFVQNIN